jgi:arginyl-tRNA synthetase
MPTYVQSYLIDRIRDALESAFHSLIGGAPSAGIEVQSTEREGFGDFTSNIAMVEAKRTGVAPRRLAEELVEALIAQVPSVEFPRIEAAGPGFVNFFANPQVVQSALAMILADATDYGRWSVGAGEKTQIEFVSSNPTGPLTVGHGRQAVLGDVLATLHEWLGRDVHREYYFNDEGRQIELLTDSHAGRVLEIAFGIDPEIPENGYEGEYLKQIASDTIAANEKVATAIEEMRSETPQELSRAGLYKHLDPAILRHEAIERVIRNIKEDLALLGVRFDNWFSEASLHRSGEVDAALAALRDRDGVYESDGAVWLKAEEYGGAKDSVLIRSDGRPTYLMVDVAYHINKRSRGFEHVIDVQGADHHAEQTCVKAALRILEYRDDFLDYASHQFVSLKEKGQIQRMSTRAGRFVTLRDLIDELGKDVIRYFMISRKPEAHLDFDLDLARAESLDNPATYIQYAHTRIASIFRKADEGDTEWANVDLSPLVEREEIELIKALDRFPMVIRIAAEEFAPHLLAEYALDLSRSFHGYYDRHRVLTDDEDLSRARLALLHALQTVLRSSLDLLGMDAPLEM